MEAVDGEAVGPDTWVHIGVAAASAIDKLVEAYRDAITVEPEAE